MTKFSLHSAIVYACKCLKKYFPSKLKKLWFHLNRLTCTLHLLPYLQGKIQEGYEWNIFLCFANFLITLLSLSDLDILHIARMENLNNIEIP